MTQEQQPTSEAREALKPVESTERQVMAMQREIHSDVETLQGQLGADLQSVTSGDVRGGLLKLQQEVDVVGKSFDVATEESDEEFIKEFPERLRWQGGADVKKKLETAKTPEEVRAAYESSVSEWGSDATWMYQRRIAGVLRKARAGELDPKQATKELNDAFEATKNAFIEANKQLYADTKSFMTDLESRIASVGWGTDAPDAVTTKNIEAVFASVMQELREAHQANIEQAVFRDCPTDSNALLELDQRTNLEPVDYRNELRERHGAWASRVYGMSKGMLDAHKAVLEEYGGSLEEPFLAGMLDMQVYRQQELQRSMPSFLRAEIDPYMMSEMEDVIEHGHERIADAVMFIESRMPDPADETAKRVILTQLKLASEAITSGVLTKRPGRRQSIPDYENMIVRDYLRAQEALGPALQILAEIDSMRLRERYEREILEPTIRLVQAQCPDMPEADIRARASQHRIDVVATTGLNAAKHWENSGGAYFSGTRTIEIPMYQKKNQHTLMHETLHALSQGESKGAEFTDFSDSETQDVLTEAVIESMNREGMTSDEERSRDRIYQAERDVLQKLRELHTEILKARGEAAGPLPLSFFAQALFKKEKTLFTAYQALGYSEEEVARTKYFITKSVLELKQKKFQRD